MSRFGEEAESVDCLGMVFVCMYELFRDVVLEHFGLSPRCVHETSTLVVS